MEHTVNYGIDLGTTNSLIAKYIQGEVEIFKNPVSWKDTLPSVVAFRKNRILVGDKAKEYLEKSPENTFGSFKRKMGTNEKFSANDQSFSPADLSAYVLKELKNHVQTQDPISAVVITIPASFDTVQANATKEAGYKAGFTQVELLQEPIAASLAYANTRKDQQLADGYWLVYDLGGGTFDVALVRIADGEMNVVDHEGNNFLGGTDFDALIVRKILIPYLEKNYSFTQLEKELTSAAGKYNNLWYALLNKAETAKIELSSREAAEIEVSGLQDEKGDEVDDIILCKRAQFEQLIEEHIEETIEMIRKIIENNNLSANQIQFILMVGGSTYIPYVREKTATALGIKANIDIDPATSVVVGAAYYAGTKTLKKPAEDASSGQSATLQIKQVFEKATHDAEVYYIASVQGDFKELFYRINREDGGYDSGLKAAKSQIQEDLPLLVNAFNLFTLSFYDAQNTLVYKHPEPIGIIQGKFSIAGQPLPEDICLELDDPENQNTKLHLVFEKNSVLPIKRKLFTTLNKTIQRTGSDAITINVLEGSHKSIPEANRTIGFMQIEGKTVSQDLIKGSDVEITLEISESRDLKVSVEVSRVDQVFEKVFNTVERNLPVERLFSEISELKLTIEKGIRNALAVEDYKLAGVLNGLKTRVDVLVSDAGMLMADDVTDTRYQLEDLKRKLSLELYEATHHMKFAALKKEYLDEKTACEKQVEKYGDYQEKTELKMLDEREKIAMEAKSTVQLKDLLKIIRQLYGRVMWKTPEYVQELFVWLQIEAHHMKNQEQAQKLFALGHQAIEDENHDRLRHIVSNLFDLLPPRMRTQEIASSRGTGLV